MKWSMLERTHVRYTVSMKYVTNLFTPATYDAFSQSDRTVSGFRESQRTMAENVSKGDVLICYMTKTSRWIGYMEIIDGPFIDKSPLFMPEDDPFVVRFHVDTKVWLPRDHTIPVQEHSLWKKLSFTKDEGYWLGPLRRSLQAFSEEDAILIIDALDKQCQSPKSYGIEEKIWEKYLPKTVIRGDGSAAVVEVPDESLDVNSDNPKDDATQARESIEIQARIARIGEAMGYKVWLPRNDRSRVLAHWDPSPGALIDQLPLNYDENTIQTIENIDVLWLNRRAIARAFEVEGTTAIYSGLLRMSDLLALQPNMDIRLHIVAPASRQRKVFSEVRRPTFSLLDRAPLYEICTLLSYDAINEIASNGHLAHLSHTVLDEYAETEY